MSSPVQIGNPEAVTIPRSFICGAEAGFQVVAKRVKEAGWAVYHVDSRHATMVTHPRELAEILVGDERYGSCIVEQLFVYALGRGIQPSDEPYFKEIEEAFVASDYKLSALIRLIAQSVPFRNRMGETLEGGAP